MVYICWLPDKSLDAHLVGFQHGVHSEVDRVLGLTSIILMYQDRMLCHIRACGVPENNKITYHLYMCEKHSSISIQWKCSCEATLFHQKSGLSRGVALIRGTIQYIYIYKVKWPFQRGDLSQGVPVYAELISFSISFILHKDHYFLLYLYNWANIHKYKLSMQPR